MNLTEITNRALENLKKTKYPPIDAYVKQGWFTLTMATAASTLGEKLVREALQADPNLERRPMQYLQNDVVCRAMFYREKGGKK